MVYSAVHAGRHHRLRTAHGCVCVPGSRRDRPRKNDTAHGDLDHLPKPAPRSDESDICHPGGAKLSLFPSRLFQGSARLPISDRESWPITEAQKHGRIRRRSNRVVGIPGRICSHLPAQAPRIPVPTTSTCGQKGDGRRERRPVGCGWWLGNGPGLESGDDVGLQTQTAAQKSREAIPGSSSGFRWAGRPGSSRCGWSGTVHEWLQPGNPLQAGVSLALNLTAEQLVASACCIIA